MIGTTFTRQIQLHLKTINYLQYKIIVCLALLYASSSAQPITGVWKGKIKSTKIELKLVKKGDSLVGTSYYYESKNNYRRYTVKGYFDDETNNVVWWDDILVEDKSSHNILNSSMHDAMMAIADFNCPGDGVMKLDGKSSLRDNKDATKVPLNLQKDASPLFGDEWDFVLANYTVGANDPYIIDSISMLAVATTPIPAGYEAAPLQLSVINKPSYDKQGPNVSASPLKEEIKTNPASSLTIEQKFANRTKSIQNIIPITGDSIELRFYDNAEIDGDSIALFLNDKLLLQHIGLTDQPYTIKIAVSDLADDNELVMVAENLGSIPPNTSLMIALVGDKRYDARLQSTEGSSAVVRFVKESKIK